MIDPGTSWRWDQSPAKCGVVKNNSCSVVIFTASLCAQSRRREGGKLLLFCCPSQTRNCENQAAIGFLQSRSSGITFLSGTTPRKGFRLGFARKTKLTPVTFPHDCMHRRTLFPVSSLWWNSRRMGDVAVSFLHVLVLFLFLLLLFASLVCPLTPSLFFLGVFAPRGGSPWCLFPVLFTWCSKIAEISPFLVPLLPKLPILLSECREDAGPFLAASWARV